MPSFDAIFARAHAGTRLTEDEALALFEGAELVPLLEAADAVNRQQHGDRVFFNVNRHINPTNICALSCKFCSYSRKPGDEGGYAYSIDEIIRKAGEAVAQGATEVHMVGGLHPRWKFSYYKEMVAAVKAAFPSLHIKAFTAVELSWLARKARLTVKEVLEELRSSGLDSLPGGGAEIFHPEIRDTICDTKMSAEEWLDVHRLAHGLGMKSNATMLYGHIETFRHRVDHLRRLRELQDETAGFNAFIPLAFQPYGNEMGIDHYTFGYDDLKTVAVARLFLDNVAHIKAYWIMLGQDVAQVALASGANDLDGTVIEEKISAMAGGRAGLGMGRTRLEQVIRRAGRTPQERDTLYRPIGSAAKVEAQGQAPQDLRAHANDQVEDAFSMEWIRAPLHKLGMKALEHVDGTAASFAPALVVAVDRQQSIGAALREVEVAIAQARTSYLLSPTVITIDLDQAARDAGEDGDPDVGHLIELLWALHQSVRGVDLAVCGVKSLWRIAQDSGVPLPELVSRLSEAGVESIETSAAETGNDLTPTEFESLHSAIHAAGLPSIAKLELSAPRIGDPLWDDFLRRTLALSSLNAGASGLMGVTVEAAPNSFVTATDYLRATALVRLALSDAVTVIAPLDRIPTLAPGASTNPEAAAVPQHPAEKIAPITLHYGAADLGVLDLRRINPVTLLKQIRGAGLRPYLRDGTFTEVKEMRTAPPAFTLRHQPTRLRTQIGQAVIAE